MQAVDSIKAMVLELQYQRFVQSDFQQQRYRYVTINPGYKVDLQQALEFKNNDPMDQRKITRDPSLKHLRPFDSLRFRDATPFQLQSMPDGNRFEVDRYGWLARQWSSTKKRNPTKNEIINGILK